MSQAIDFDRSDAFAHVPNPWEVRLHPDSAAAWTVNVTSGSATAAVLAQLDPERLSQAGRVDALVGLERLQAWAAALQARMITALIDEPHVGAPAPKLDRKWAEEDVPPPRAAVPSGVRTVSTTAVLPVPERISDPAPTLAAFRRKLRKAGIAADPRSAAEKAPRAAEDRDVWVIPQDNGMAYVGAPLPAEGAATVAAAVDAKAEQIRTTDDPRTKAQRRADGLVQICADYLNEENAKIKMAPRSRTTSTLARPAVEPARRSKWTRPDRTPTLSSIPRRRSKWTRVWRLGRGRRRRGITGCGRRSTSASHSPRCWAWMNNLAR
ncbi:MAG TPA: DUF222 domain-containing protein [Jatrophihabitantaceae bacterium]|jgi:hypothetical protein|nr:DUF222 domain-containing protein [Jatrophihabitantaceae bacterium]